MHKYTWDCRWSTEIVCWGGSCMNQYFHVYLYDSFSPRSSPRHFTNGGGSHIKNPQVEVLVHITFTPCFKLIRSLIGKNMGAPSFGWNPRHTMLEFLACNPNKYQTLEFCRIQLWSRQPNGSTSSWFFYWGCTSVVSRNFPLTTPKRLPCQKRHLEIWTVFQREMLPLMCMHVLNWILK